MILCDWGLFYVPSGLQSLAVAPEIPSTLPITVPIPRNCLGAVCGSVCVSKLVLTLGWAVLWGKDLVVVPFLPLVTVWAWHTVDRHCLCGGGLTGCSDGNEFKPILCSSPDPSKKIQANLLCISPKPAGMMQLPSGRWGKRKRCCAFLSCSPFLKRFASLYWGVEGLSRVG